MTREWSGASAELTIEPLRRRHLRRVLRIEENAYPKPWTYRTFVDELAGVRIGTRHYLAAYVGDDLVGYAGMLFSGDDAHVTNIAVDPGWRGRGVATEMMLDLCDVARSRGCQAMTLEVRHTNDPAQGLYRKFGFAPAGVRRRYYENVDDAIIMWCEDIQSGSFAARLDRIRDEAHR